MDAVYLFALLLYTASSASLSVLQNRLFDDVSWHHELLAAPAQ